LTKLYPYIPVLSEEGKEIPYQDRKNWQRFWCVDPLDGTKEFIKRNGEFTVNIALIENRKPIAGVIYVPVTKEVYFGDVENGSFKISSEGSKKKISVSGKTSADELNVVQSRSHSWDTVKNFERLCGTSCPTL
jgi:3'(2'), 5'-bisphosphate nucleotidase